MTKKEFIGNYLDKKMKGCPFDYGLDYLYFRNRVERESEKKWKTKKKAKR